VPIRLARRQRLNSSVSSSAQADDPVSTGLC
jgi:hypothetical protein